MGYSRCEWVPNANNSQRRVMVGGGGVVAGTGGKHATGLLRRF
jgi:hypothetical protein